MTFNYSGMILAAGFGKRMMPLTKNKPKPLIEINGITLLENSINFLILLGCKEIIINSHYKHERLKYFLKDKFENIKIKLLYEENILDTGGGVKNAIPFFSNENIVVLNSDIYWQNDNLQDVKLLIESYSNNTKIHLLLSKKNTSFGLKKDLGDFTIKDGKIFRFIKGDEVLYYSGLQILNLNTFKNIYINNFSFNEVWDDLIKNHSLFGEIMNSNLYHVGDIHGLRIAKKLDS